MHLNLLVNSRPMQKTIILTLPLLLFACLGNAQNICPCCSDQHQLFDFWAGDWLVFDTSGTQVGENTIVKLENGCILNEHWRGAQGGTGRSYNYYDNADSTWNQLWIDNQGSNLNLKGKGTPGSMILESDLQPGKRVDYYFNRITWSANENGTVRQLWEILDKEGNVLSTAFDGLYRKKDQ